MVVDQPKAARRYRSELAHTDRFYARAIVLGVLIEQIEPGSDWRKRLVALIDKYPKVPTAKMGFPADWRTRTFWV